MAKTKNKQTQKTKAVPPLFIFALRNVTEAAARVVYDTIGRDQKDESNALAAAAMRNELAKLPISATVVVGDAHKDVLNKSSSLYNGEKIGDASRHTEFDIAVDPVEGTGYLAKGMTNAMSVIAMAPRGTLFEPGPAFYMEKFAAPKEAAGKVDPEAPVKDKLSALAKALGKPVKELTVFVLEKPRHNALVSQIHEAGARVALYPAGDVAGALMAAIPNSGIDALMGTGGIPEGVLSACAIKAMDGVFTGRLDPQLPSERLAVIDQGLDTDRWHQSGDLVRSDEVYFSATGITTGLLFSGVERNGDLERTETLVISGLSGERQILSTYHRIGE
ncbi:MAG: fructose-bisphosphatase class II [Rhodospirillaceae bacterium]|jgi:fructose-1,6-bisphosphatase II|nr:fructose-bisphosphatase class II [Rhodospirillaceae bacterium]|tara:strand:- start:3036 stop:4034 length:999 start_codon:yes stop_codon:yes gene_type:complete